MIKNLIFDVGGVLLDYRWKEMLMDYGLDEENAIRVGTEMFEDEDRIWDIFDLAVKSDEEIADMFCKKKSRIPLPRFVLSLSCRPRAGQTHAPWHSCCRHSSQFSSGRAAAPPMSA